MIELQLAKGEAEHADWRIDDPFPRKRRDQHVPLAICPHDVKEPLPREASLRVWRTNTLDLNRRSFGRSQLLEVTLQEDGQQAPFRIHDVPSAFGLGGVAEEFPPDDA
ncbi:hypothetical protein [Stagnihabitans tardus]|uniref:Uncharacterized protein n=1 Tax=Stagnihabitans tardus TaxID=2699202 RepID=A0AAE4YC27_9RHOB|nr:hypothetical protein [Stagnihabitans tardus]NBZ89214.1 hypothetical protein [Stagnihabitans tardus]